MNKKEHSKHENDQDINICDSGTALRVTIHQMAIKWLNFVGIHLLLGPIVHVEIYKSIQSKNTEQFAVVSNSLKRRMCENKC